MAEYWRNLPHFHPKDRPLFLTWRLWGSMPRIKLSDTRSFLTADRLLDRPHTGPLWLRDPRIAQIICHALLAGERQKRFYELTSWVIMPNHVHVLLLPQTEPRHFMHWLKGSTARPANQLLNRTGQPFWQNESFDYYLRDPRQRNRAVAYIENNPVSAGLVSSATDWPWSSASKTS